MFCERIFNTKVRAIKILIFLLLNHHLKIYLYDNAKNIVYKFEKHRTQILKTLNFL